MNRSLLELVVMTSWSPDPSLSQLTAHTEGRVLGPAPPLLIVHGPGGHLLGAQRVTHRPHPAPPGQQACC